ncbi:MAG TPA: NrsF family protein [Polyangiaceae bacterium]|nr:NrsF family protein [Polyangiaceae bacterium]
MSTQNPDPLADLPWPKPEAPGDAVSAKICGACTKNLCAKRGLSAVSRLSLCLFVSGLVASYAYWFGVRHHRSELGLRMGVYGAVVWGLVQAAVLYVGFAPRRGLLGSRSVRVAVAVVLPVLFLGYLSYAAWSYVPFDQFSHGARASHAFSCGLIALLFGAIVGGSVLLAWRGTNPVTPRLSGTLAGFVGGVGGALAVGIGCPSHEAWHLWTAHGLIVLALGLLGFGVGRRLLSP